ncbi:hydrogenase maturation nickel metallochaperone HypA/HybF [Tindallia californiensis]|uniref:hydrogenase maturation nickel metallochaperone HypA/HybF n=1 Tax=Tindallia californiensis TaxID=159292 RepID=UPI000B831F8E|nr:hydrogenase maturation nickel metallochaperone HypA [Tindallia californiensis]
MHELGVVIEVVKSVQRVAQEHKITEIDTLVLQIGELSSMIPRYVEACYPAAVEGTLLENTKLEIEVIPANGRCRGCGHLFHLIQHPEKCPGCQSTNWELLRGKEFFIKEILAR